MCKDKEKQPSKEKCQICKENDADYFIEVESGYGTKGMMLLCKECNRVASVIRRLEGLKLV